MMMNKKLTFFLILGLCQGALAQDDAALQEAQERQLAEQNQVVNKVYNYNDRPLNVSGEVEEEVISDSELEYINGELRKQKRSHKLNKEKTKGYKKLKNTTEKLVDSTEEYVAERNDSEKMIKDYNKKIKCLLQENASDPECQVQKDQVQVKQAAPVVVENKVVQEEPVEEAKPFEKIKVFAGLGISNYTSDNIGNIESDTAFDIRAESAVWSQLTIGLGFNYQTVNFTDVPLWNYSSLYLTNNYFGFYGNFGRQIEMESMGVDIYAKFYLFNSSRVRPYVMGTLGYKRLSFEYQNNNPYVGFQGFQFGNENYTTNILDSRAAAGAEYSFTENFGVFAELSYGMSFTEFGGSDTIWNFPDQQRLQDLSNELVGSGVFSINAGLTLSF